MYADLRGSSFEKLGKYLDVSAAERLIHAFVTARLDLNNGLLYGIPACHTKRLRRIQYASAQILTKCHPQQSMTPVLHKLHWLPIPQRVEYKLLLMVFKCLQGEAPEYLSDLLSVKLNTRTLRSSNQLLLDHQKTKTTATYGDRAFSIAAPKLWNTLPDAIKLSSTINSFKASLKTYLFKVAFK